MERDWAAHATALGTAGAAKWVNRHEYCLTQPRATISINIPTGPCGGPAAEFPEGVGYAGLLFRGELLHPGHTPQNSRELSGPSPCHFVIPVLGPS